MVVIATEPDVTVKFVVGKKATPAFDDVASSPDIVTVLLDTTVLIPSPAKNSILPPNDTEPCVELSSVKKMLEFVNLAFVTLASNILAVVTASLANSLAPTPNALILKASEETSIVVSSTATSKVLPVFVKAAPALIWPAPEN